MAPTTHTRPTPDHPPYGEMISAAIKALKEQGGSTTAASIDSFIKSEYDEHRLPQAHSNLFPYHLSKLLALGEIQQPTPDTYIITPEDNIPNPNPFPPPPSHTPTPPRPAVRKRKRRGRPPRPKPQHQQGEAAAAQGCQNVPLRRGRSSMAANGTGTEGGLREEQQITQNMF